MQFVLIDTERKSFVKGLSISLYTYGNMLDIPCTDVLSAAYKFIDMESAVFAANLLNSLRIDPIYTAVPCDDSNAIFVLLHN